jgi:dienelactone hydrolase
MEPPISHKWNSEFLSYPQDSPPIVLEERSLRVEELLEKARHPMEATYQRREFPVHEGCKQRKCRLWRLLCQASDGTEIPVILVRPGEMPPPYPLVILAHGFDSNKYQMSYWVAGELVSRGIAVLAPDMPFHGERKGHAPDIRGHGDVHAFYRNMRQAVIELRQLIDFAQARNEFDTLQGIGLLGYSMGSWISSLAASADPRVKALVLMVEGTPAEELESPNPDSQFFGILNDRLDLWKEYPQMRPCAALQAYASRPLLMLNGQRDRLIPAEAAKRLFAQAGEPKEQRWYDAGHLLPPEAFYDASQWLENILCKK